MLRIKYVVFRVIDQVHKILYVQTFQGSCVRYNYGWTKEELIGVKIRSSSLIVTLLRNFGCVIRGSIYHTADYLATCTYLLKCCSVPYATVRYAIYDSLLHARIHTCMNEQG